MTDAEIDQLVKLALFEVAPDLEGMPVEPQENFRDQFEIDSMDFLNFVIALHNKTGLEIPEKDYAKLESLSKATDYLRQNLA